MRLDLQRTIILLEAMPSLMIRCQLMLISLRMKVIPACSGKNYYNWKLAQPGAPHGIDAIITVHEKYAGSSTDILYCDHDLYMMQHKGNNGQPGFLFILNNTAGWNGRQVTTQWAITKFTPLAWCGKDTADAPFDKCTDAIGKADFWAPPRGYAVYVPGS